MSESAQVFDGCVGGDHVAKEVQFMDRLARTKALNLLMLGAVFGLCGFLFAAIAGFKAILTSGDTVGTLGGKFKSGNPYYPLTVSEMVSDSSSPAGKVFLGFELLGALMILMSWYPYQLRNAYIGVRHTLLTDQGAGQSCCGSCCPSWTTLRQFLPGLGLATVALVSTTPVYDKTLANISFITCQIHILGATALFGGYIIVEMQALFFAEPRGEVKMKRNEKTVRIIFIVVTAVGAFITIAIQQIYGTAITKNLCCFDTFERVNINNLTALFNTTTQADQHTQGGDEQAIAQDFSARVYASLLFAQGKQVATNTASGAALVLKHICFWAEVVAGVFGIGSHLVIWYYAPERDIALADYDAFKDLDSKDASDSEEYSE